MKMASFWSTRPTIVERNSRSKTSRKFWKSFARACAPRVSSAAQLSSNWSLVGVAELEAEALVDDVHDRREPLGVGVVLCAFPLARERDQLALALGQRSRALERLCDLEMGQLDLGTEVEPLGGLAGQIGEQRSGVEVVALEMPVDVRDDLGDELVHRDEAREHVAEDVLHLLVQLEEARAGRVERGVDPPVPRRLGCGEQRGDA